MIQKILYTGNGVSLSPVYAEGRTESKYVRLIAYDGMAITNGTAVTVCVDVPKENAYLWTDCECNWQWYLKKGFTLVEEATYEKFSTPNNQYKTYIFKKRMY